MSGEHPVFVYGTLMASGAMAHLLGARPQFPATTRGELWALPAGYPALRPVGDRIVHGAWLDPLPDPLLTLLDRYEGVDEGLYRRALIDVDLPGVRFRAWAWVMDHPERRGARRVPSGRWWTGRRG